MRKPKRNSKCLIVNWCEQQAGIDPVLTIKLSDMFTILLLVTYGIAINSFSTNVSFTDKLGIVSSY